MHVSLFIHISTWDVSAADSNQILAAGPVSHGAFQMSQEQKQSWLPPLQLQSSALIGSPFALFTLGGEGHKQQGGGVIKWVDGKRLTREHRQFNSLARFIWIAGFKLRKCDKLREWMSESHFPNHSAVTQRETVVFLVSDAEPEFLRCWQLCVCRQGRWSLSQLTAASWRIQTFHCVKLQVFYLNLKFTWFWCFGPHQQVQKDGNMDINMQNHNF